MKRKILGVVLGLTLAAVVCVGFILGVIKFYGNVQTAMKQNTELAEKQELCESLSKELKEMNTGNGEAGFDSNDKVAVTSAMLAGENVSLETATAYTIKDGELKKLAVINSKSVIAELSDNANVVEYVINTGNNTEYLKELAELPIMIDRITVLPITEQVCVRVNFGNGGM